MQQPVQRGQQVGAGLLEEARGELVQQAADVFGGIDKQLRLFGGGNHPTLLVQGTAPKACSSARAMSDSG
ncbi:hypothetical protein Y695_04710 [Hydrogenophaga sp. T4]|nr:hypothetical protein Y695_04710 [Hydrogenophaga sp. T4]